MHAFEDTIDALVGHAPEVLVRPLEALAPAPDFWSAAPLGDLPAMVVDAAPTLVTEAELDEHRHAHQLGLIFGWMSEGPDDPAEDPRLRGFVLGRWKAALAEAARVAPSRVVDRVVHSMRWMRWGLSSESVAHRSGQWTLPEFHRCLRWKAAGRGLATSLLLGRRAPGKSAAFERVYEQLVLGLAQTSIGRHSTLPRLLGCGREELHGSGVLAMRMAQIEAEAAGLGRLSDYCRGFVRDAEAKVDPARRSEIRTSKVTQPDTPSRLERHRKPS